MVDSKENYKFDLGVKVSSWQLLAVFMFYIYVFEVK